MNTVRVRALFAFVLTLSVASGAWAVDEGQTRPRLDTNTVLLTATPVDIIPLTSDSGNIKGYQCSKVGISTANVRLHFYVDGGTAQTINPASAIWQPDPNGDLHTAVLPTNIRFETSIKVSLQKLSGTGGATCMVSWGLD
ncbi:MAG TPA: hypothetical protein VF179_26275 [Thermoanaerobaculia bacterium]|nr:hypothetical protein [Thermoanaerobaculia bacterium]